MKVIHYCQHVLGMGHFFRSLEIARALSKHEVTLVTGGPPVDAALPDHVKEFRLPGLMFDQDFKNLSPAQEDRNLEEIQQERQRQLWNVFNQVQPDLFLIELYPFGRNAFRHELNPILQGIRTGELPPCRVVCSLRDILVEKNDQAAYEQRVVRRLQTGFDAVLVHADPEVMRLDRTFSRVNDLPIPIAYTGFVTRSAPEHARNRMRRKMGLKKSDLLVVASAGGGKVGFDLLRSVLRAATLLETGRPLHLQVFTGPFMSTLEYRRLERRSGGLAKVSRFTSDFLSYLAAADLSVSMAGYNTCMNVLAARVPALVWPFVQNREQRLRSEALQERGLVRIIEGKDLGPDRLAGLMGEVLSQKRRSKVGVDLDGAKNTADWLRNWMKKSWKPVLSYNYSSIWMRPPTDMKKKIRKLVDDGLTKAETKPVKVFFRADDVGVPGANFTNLIQLFTEFQTPLALAVVPVWLTQGRWEALRKWTASNPDLWCWHQHGWRHVNHEPFGRKSEFGKSRAPENIEDDILKGRQRLERLMGAPFTPIFTPPWNRMADSALDAIKDLGFKAVSRNQSAKPPAPDGLKDWAVNVDLHTRSEIDPGAAWDGLAFEMVEALGSGMCGIMIHHQRMNKAAFLFLRELLAELKTRPEIEIKGLNELANTGNT
jgi:predicted glycosyltransferase/peptidoglycan/xylan/chitin deacetylase (PgdA/CDA1 family)